MPYIKLLISQLTFFHVYLYFFVCKYTSVTNIYLLFIFELIFVLGTLDSLILSITHGCTALSNDSKGFMASSPFKKLFQLVPPIVFSFRAHTLSFNWRPYAACHGMTLVSHWRFHNNLRMILHLRMYLIITMFKCWILLRPLLGLHFPLPHMNRLNQIAILLFWAFFRGSVFLILAFDPADAEKLLQRYIVAVSLNDNFIIKFFFGGGILSINYY